MTASSNPSPARRTGIATSARRAGPVEGLQGRLDRVGLDGEVARRLGDEQHAQPPGERPILGGPGVAVAQTREQIAGQGVLDHAERRHGRSSYRGTGEGTGLPSGPFSLHHGGLMQRFFGYWFPYGGSDPA